MRYNFDCCYQNQLLKIDISCDGVARGCFLLKFKGGGEDKLAFLYVIILFSVLQIIILGHVLTRKSKFLLRS